MTAGSPVDLTAVPVLGSGFIGSHLVEILVERDAKARGLDNHRAGRLRSAGLRYFNVYVAGQEPARPYAAVGGGNGG